MQPPPLMPPEETNGKGSNANANAPATNIKKRRAPVKKKKATVKHHDKRDPTKPIEAEGNTAPVDPVIVATPSVSETTRTPGPYRGKCLYQSRKCENERAVKRNGKSHNLCEEHRSKQNQHQRKFDAKKFSHKRRRGSVSDEDTTVDEDKLQSHRNDEPISKRHRSMTNHEAEMRTPHHVTTNSQPTTPMVAAMRGSFPPVHTARSTPMSAPMMRLPSLQSPQGLILPPSPAIVHTHSGSLRPGVVPEAYPRGHVVYSDYRPGAGRVGYSGQQSPHISHRPYLQQQVAQPPPGYSHSELVAANTLVQPQPSPPSSTPVYHKNEVLVAGPPRESPRQATLLTTPRMLPSLLVPPSAALSPSPYHRVSGILASPAQRFASLVMTPAASGALSPARSVGNVLPPLMPFGLRRSPTSTPSVSKQPQ